MTIALDDETARWARIEAARRDTSMSKLVGGLLREQMARAGREADRYEQSRRSYLARRARPLSGGKAYPSRDELHQR